MPDVQSLGEDEAIAALEEAGLTVRIRREVTDDPALVGIVLRQEPAPGATAGRGEEVVIVVGEE